MIVFSKDPSFLSYRVVTFIALASYLWGYFIGAVSW